MPSENQSWRAKLSTVREKVVVAEKDREHRKQQEKERSREALSERLKKDTPESLTNEFNDLKKRCGQVARKVYPADNLREQLTSLADLGDRFRLYKDAQREHGSLFSVPMKQALNKLLNSLGEIQRSLDKQLGQWQAVEDILNATEFRTRRSGDDARLNEIAKSFSREAYDVALILPSGYFSSESAHFYVAQGPSGVYGLAKCWMETKSVSFSVIAPDKVNFKKLARAFVCVFLKRAPETADATMIRLRLSDPREFKFYQEWGFRRDSSSPEGLICVADL